MTDDGSSSTRLPDPPDAAVRLFGDELALATRYAQLLAGTGVAHGHIGPREVPRLWLRHLVNSALVADLVPEDAAVLDVGSGAGLPGIPMAVRRPDLRVTLLEPMQRRSDFLTQVVTELGLGERVTVVRGRADEAAVRSQWGGQRWVTARAVAPLDRLVKWCVPLLALRGRLLALKGASALDEVEQHAAVVRRVTGGPATVVELGGTDPDERTWVVSVQQQTTQRRTARRAR